MHIVIVIVCTMLWQCWERTSQTYRRMSSVEISRAACGEVLQVSVWGNATSDKLSDSEPSHTHTPHMCSCTWSCQQHQAHFMVKPSRNAHHLSIAHPLYYIDHVFNCIELFYTGGEGHFNLQLYVEVYPLVNACIVFFCKLSWWLFIM